MTIMPVKGTHMQLPMMCQWKVHTQSSTSDNHASKMYTHTTTNDTYASKRYTHLPMIITLINGTHPHTTTSERYTHTTANGNYASKKVHVTTHDS